MTSRVQYSKDETSAPSIAVLHLDDGRANAMQMAFFDELRGALDRAEGDEVHSVVLLGRERFFSAGLDLKVLPDLSAAELRDTIVGLNETMKRVFLFPKPVLAAATGYAIAGGMMLYLAADLRLALDGTEARFGLNEASTGLRISGGLAAICQTAIPPQHHTELILQGRMMDAPETAARGITHETVQQPSPLLPRALARARSLGELDLPAYAANKLTLREPTWNAAEELGGDLDELAANGNPFARIRR